MNRFRIWLCPELTRFKTAESRLAAFRLALHQTFRRNWKFDVLVSIGLFLAVTLFAFVVNETKMFRAVSIWIRFAFMVSFSWAGAFVLFILVRGPMRRHLRTQLVEKGIPICLACGYDLRGQVEARCPECGTPFDPALLGRVDSGTPNATMENRNEGDRASSTLV